MSKTIKTLLLVLISLTSGVSGKKYNILALDGGAIKGMITQQCMMEIETFAYDYAMLKKYKIP